MVPDARARNPRTEASALLGDGRTGVVLEPSPPAIDVAPWFADDPVDAPTTGTVVTPLLTEGPGSWEEAAARDDAVAAFARHHWLGNLALLPEPPAALTETRLAFTALAFNVLAPARQQANGKIGLRWTKGGFGTPFFGDDRQLRVEGDQIVAQDRGHVTSWPITTIRAAATHVEVEPGPPTGIDFHDPPAAVPFDERLHIDREAAAFLDSWFGFGTLSLERLRAVAGSPLDTRVQLWPEHFDLAIELGDADRGSRASFGVSPGDAVTPIPYLYVAPWQPQQGDLWDAPFGGAALSLDELPGSEEQLEAALAFFQRARDALG